MPPNLQTLSEPVKIDGVSFQTFISHTILPIPEKVAGGKTWFKAGIRVTNGTYQDYYFFNFPIMFRPSINLPSGEIFMAGFDADAMMLIKNNHLILAEPGESVDILWNACLAWTQFYKNTIKTKGKKIRGVPEPYKNDPKLTFLFPFKNYVVLYYAEMEPFSPKPDKYQFGFSYSMGASLEEIQHHSSYENIMPSVHSKIWIGSVHTLFVPVEIVEREAILSKE